MEIRRAVPVLTTTDPEATRAFYQDFLGFRLAMEQDGMYLFASVTTPTTQVMVTWDSPTAEDPVVVGVDVSVEVPDAAQVHARAVAEHLDIVYPLTDEPWGVRRFFLRDPTGRVINVASHLGSGSGR